MRGVFLVRAGHGYSVQVDGHDLKLEVSWTAADALAKHIAQLRKPGDGRGYARCRHEGDKRCFDAGEHLERVELSCEIGFDATGVGGWCVTHKRWQCPGS